MFAVTSRKKLKINNMKVWNNYIKNEWIIFVPIIVVSIAINDNTENMFWNNLSYYIGLISFYLLMALVVLRTFIAFRNWYKSTKK
jgi:hypothetical protein